ncbi:DinB family protein [Larkinella soli]|uniref:DinB family protein n=1 Tax=Larkinella soli TaxID=1770527 RepID=UPI000FFB48C9|nr:DinB family protein [Larkinella soli]
MKTELLTEIWNAHRQSLAGPLKKLTPDNFRNRLRPETASAGFIALHIAESILDFGKPFFGFEIPFEPRTLRASDPGEELSPDAVQALLRQALEAMTTAIGQMPDDQWQEVVSSQVGSVTRLQGLVFIMHHNSYHIGQMAQALKKGEMKNEV